MQPTQPTDILKIQGSAASPQQDMLVVEEPLEIRLGFERAGVRHQKNVSVTMRTPGHDEDLALGFLFTEGIIWDYSQVKKISRPVVRRQLAKENVITVELAEGLDFDFKKLERHFYTTSSCGVCGKASIEAVAVQGRFHLPEGEPKIRAELLHGLPALLSESQSVFGSTGGLHAAALFDAAGKMLAVREDVGRHNALDKIIGSALRNGEVPLGGRLVLVSGRAGFELVQKSVVAGVPILAAVGAPTSLAVELAEEAGLTLIGFLRNGQFNIYTCQERIVFSR